MELSEVKSGVDFSDAVSGAVDLAAGLKARRD